MNTSKKIKVSIGIPAFNEQFSIKNVIEQVLSQQPDGWKLHEVLVICDGCTDATVQQASSVKHPKLRIFEDHKRRGKTYRLKQLFQYHTGDVLVMFDADIKLQNQSVVTQLINPFVKDQDVMLVGGNSQPFPPKTFVEKAVYSTFEVFYQSRVKIKSGHNIFGATGSVLAIRKQFSKEIRLPTIVNEDAYIYLDCIRRGYTFRYQDRAIVYYKTPTNFKDYIKQLFRSNPESVGAELNKYFGRLVEDEFARPTRFYLTEIIKSFWKNPAGVITIILINLTCRPLHNLVINNYKLEWFTAHSTHQE